MEKRQMCVPHVVLICFERMMTKRFLQVWFYKKNSFFLNFFAPAFTEEKTCAKNNLMGE
jgi:hypothetical protein